MKLPNGDQAIIPQDKLTAYLLDLDHIRGGSKAKLLVSLGYTATHWQQLANDLLHFHVESDVVEQKTSPWGNATKSLLR